jgi:hypothetical protein
MPAVAEPFIYSSLAPYGPFPGPSNRTELRSALLKHLGPSILEQHNVDLEYHINRLLGSNDTDIFFEFLIFVMHSRANNEMADIDSIENVLSWFVRQNAHLLKIIFPLLLSTMHAFLDFVILRATESHIISG